MNPSPTPQPALRGVVLQSFLTYLLRDITRKSQGTAIWIKISDRE